jgi:hypothetical protein
MRFEKKFDVNFLYFSVQRSKIKLFITNTRFVIQDLLVLFNI